ncbi:unnamed protein product [Brachionus calyciflorus]|uniref:Uncharacterized protein n=1 Tax=Brachionus calyciflorus TaxID=104777 RepID=A0A814H5H7_9BILA|nr:unnamed protein product [Brachionus calyciflorus]
MNYSKKFPDHYLLISPSSLFRNRSNFEDKTFSDSIMETQVFIEDYKDSILKSYSNYYPYENDHRQIRENWESIYRVKLKPDFKFIESNFTKSQEKISNQKFKNVPLPEIVLKKNEKNLELNSKKSHGYKEAIDLPLIKIRRSDKPIEPIRKLEADVIKTNEMIRKKSLRSQLKLLNSINLEESNSKLAKNLYYHPKTLSFTPYIKNDSFGKSKYS